MCLLSFLSALVHNQNERFIHFSVLAHTFQGFSFTSFLRNNFFPCKKERKTPNVLQRAKALFEMFIFCERYEFIPKTISTDIARVGACMCANQFLVCVEKPKEKWISLIESNASTLVRTYWFLLCKYTLSNINKNMNRNSWTQLNIMTPNSPLSIVIFLARFENMRMDLLCKIPCSSSWTISVLCICTWTKSKFPRFYFHFELCQTVYALLSSKISHT